MPINKSKLEKCLVIIIYALMAVIFFLPLTVNFDFYFPFVTFRNLIFRFTVEIQMMLFLILCFKNSDYLPKLNLPAISLLIFTGVIALANTFGVDPYNSFWGNFERMDGFNGLIHLFAFFLVLSSVMKTKKQWFYLSHYSLVICLLVSAIGLYSLSINPAELISATLGNSSYLGVYCLFHIFLSAWLFSNLLKTNRKLCCFYLISIIILLITLYNTGSRGTLLGLILGAFLTAVLLLQKKNASKIIIAIISVAVLSSASLWISKNSPFVQNNKTLKRIVEAPTSSGVRVSLWKIAFVGIKEKPVLGWGQDNFEYVFDKHYSLDLGDAEFWFDRTHNTILDWTVAGGIPGGLAYLLIFILSLSYFWKKDEARNDKVFISGILFSYFIYNLFMFDFLISFLMFFSILSYIAWTPIAEEKFKKSKLLFLSVVTIFMGINLFTINPAATEVAYKTGQASKTFESDLQSSLVNLHDSLKLHSFANNEVIGLLGLTSTRASILHPEIFQAAVSEINTEDYLNPMTLKKWITLSSFSGKKNDSNPAAMEQAFEEGLRISPNRQLVYSDLINYYFKFKMYDKAFSTSKKLYDLYPQSNRSTMYYALSAIYTNHVELSDSLLPTIFSEMYVQNKIFFEAYTYIGRKDKLVEHLKKLIGHHPEESSYHLKLGLLYSEMGKTEEAAAEQKKAQELAQEELNR